MARSKTGEAISERGRTPTACKKLRRFIRQRLKDKDLDAWRRGRAVLGYIQGQRVVQLAAQADVTRGSVNRWLQWYQAEGISGLLTQTAPGPSPKLTEQQRGELGALIESGPIAAGYRSGVWTGPMIGALIEQRFGVLYHNHHVPRRAHSRKVGSRSEEWRVENLPSPKSGRLSRRQPERVKCPETSLLRSTPS